VTALAAPLPTAKIRDPVRTAKGERRAAASLGALRPLWFNIGTLCNLTCANCYIESPPRNDTLIYLTAAEVRGYLDEIARDALPVQEIGFTGGEPFLNSDMIPMLADTLGRDFRNLVIAGNCEENLSAAASPSSTAAPPRRAASSSPPPTTRPLRPRSRRPAATA
jgi:hypothetical protein